MIKKVRLSKEMEVGLVPLGRGIRLVAYLGGYVTRPGNYSRVHSSRCAPR